MSELGYPGREPGTATLSRTAGRWIAITLAVASFYYVGGRLGLSLALVPTQIAPLWPPSGIAVVSLLFFGHRALPGILLGAAAVSVALGLTATAVVAITAGNVLAPFLAWWLLTRAGFRPQLQRGKDALSLIMLGALGSMLVCALIGSGSLVLSGTIDGTRFWPVLLLWWAGDAMGVLVVAPVLLVGYAVRQAPSQGVRRRVEAAGLLVVTAAVAVGLATGLVPVLIGSFPLLVWGAWRFGIIAAAPCTLLVSIATTLAAGAARGPFAGIGLAQQMLILHVFNGAAAVTVLVLAAAAAEQRAARLAVEQAGAELETRVRERTADLAGAVQRLEHSERMFTEAQRAGRIGSWERDLATGKLTWSDELFRLYGLPPHSAEIDYQWFLDRVHPDDRELLALSNEQALRDRRPVASDFRVVWPDGSVHWLHRRGDVVVGEHGDPVTMVGTAQDITATKLAELALHRSEDKARTLLASITDAIVGVDGSGRIVLVNDRTAGLFGYQEQELTGLPVEVLLPERFHVVHEQHRAAFMTAPQTRPMGVGLDLVGRRKDGTEFPADIALRPLATTGPSYGGALVVVAVRDATERRRAEQAAQELREARLRRRQALEINDTVVQGLTTAIYALERGRHLNAQRTLHATLATAREMMRNLLGANTAITPGELARDTPAVLAAAGDHDPLAPRLHHRGAVPPIGVVLADDSTEIRLALRAFVESLGGIGIVGEAADGAEAVRIVTETQPDALLLDLAMPVLDGLQALPQIRRHSPDTKVIVLSGYGRDQVAKQALSLGAVAFVEKGGSLQKLTSLLEQLFPGAISASFDVQEEPPDNPPDEPPIGAELALQDTIVSTYAHELRNPIAALSSIVELLRDRIDKMPSSTVNNLLAAMTRGLNQMDQLVRAVTDAHRLGEGELDLILEPTNLGNLVQAVLTEHGELTGNHPITLDIPSGVVTGLDPLRIRQVLSNLLSNAVKFSPRNSPINITITELADTIEIAVTDHGRGVPPQYRDKLFGKFARFGADAGLGLGLYLCQQIAREHGGDTTLADTSPQGTTFVVSLPRFLD